MKPSPPSRPCPTRAFARLLFLGALVLAAPLRAPAQAPAPILSAYAGQNETVGPMWVGIAKGTFKKYGLDVRMVQLRNGERRAIVQIEKLP